MHSTAFSWAPRSAVPSRHRRASAEAHSIGVPHHTVTPRSPLSTWRSSCVWGSPTHNGTSAEESQNLNGRFYALRARPSTPIPRDPLEALARRSRPVCARYPLLPILYAPSPSLRPEASERSWQWPSPAPSPPPPLPPSPEPDTCSAKPSPLSPLPSPLREEGRRGECGLIPQQTSATDPASPPSTPSVVRGPSPRRRLSPGGSPSRGVPPSSPGRASPDTPPPS